MPIIKTKERNPKGLEAKVRDKIYDEYTCGERSICESFFNALTNWFGEVITCFLGCSTITRISLRTVAYAVRILLRLNINL